MVTSKFVRDSSNRFNSNFDKFYDMVYLRIRQNTKNKLIRLFCEY